MYETQYNYCPLCLDEYRAEIEICATCQTVLKTGEEMKTRAEEDNKRLESRAGEIKADDDLVSVRRGPLSEMKIYEKLLMNQKIGVMLAGDESTCGKGCCPGNFDLVVRREDAREALLIVETEIRRTAVIDNNGAGGNDTVFDPLSPDNICPACGHNFSGGTECPDCGLCF